jgi:hypothetical protein
MGNSVAKAAFEAINRSDFTALENLHKAHREDFDEIKNTASDDDGYTLLARSIVHGHNPEMTKQLLEWGCDPNATMKYPLFGPRNESRHTTLTSYFCVDPECLALLLKFGLNVNATDELGNTLLHWCAIHERSKRGSLAGLLIAAGANPNKFNNAGLTPLHICASLGAYFGTEVARTLLAGGADRNLRTFNEKQLTAFDLAIEVGGFGVFQELTNGGSRVPEGTTWDQLFARMKPDMQAHFVKSQPGQSPPTDGTAAPGATVQSGSPIMDLHFAPWGNRHI